MSNKGLGSQGEWEDGPGFRNNLVVAAARDRAAREMSVISMHGHLQAFYSPCLI